MHLAYLDDSDTKAKMNKWQVMSAVIIDDYQFRLAEKVMSYIPDDLMGSEKVEKFEEFHACELYGGYGPFEGIDQERRFGAISQLLSLLDLMDTAIVYGAVDLDALKTDVHGSADPVDVCFRKCLLEIVSWSAKRERHIRTKLNKDTETLTYENLARSAVPSWMTELTVLIVDECDGKTKNALQKSFRSLRPPRTSQTPLSFGCFHDDMYFGDSRYSIGIQLADICSYFIGRHLEGDAEVEGFYQIIEPRIFTKTSEIENSIEELTNDRSAEV